MFNTLTLVKLRHFFHSKVIFFLVLLVYIQKFLKQKFYVQNASMKLSGTKIKRILSEERSPASVSCQIDIATPENSGNYKMELENLQDVKLNHEVSTQLSSF